MAVRGTRVFGLAVMVAGMMWIAAASAQVSPEYTDWMRTGREAYKADDFAAAEAAFKAVLAAAQSPRQRATANGLLAMTAEQMKRAGDAQAYAEEALRHFPDEARAKEVLARLGRSLSGVPAGRAAR